MRSYTDLKPLIDETIQSNAQRMYGSFYKKEQSNFFESMSKDYWSALLYASLGDGKRIRPSLVYYFATGRGCEDLPSKKLENFLCAIEWVHTYSLVHDDLPCMDNDDFRRGRPTVHKKFNEALAMLTGDALLTDAFGLISAPEIRIDSSLKIHAIQNLCHAAGSRSMILGQALDLANTNIATSLGSENRWNEEHLQHIHSLKTGKLMGASCVLGLCLGSQDFGTTVALTDIAQSFGEKLGLVFQMIDDILDASTETGKSKGKDKASGKITFLDLFGEAKTKKIALEWTQQELEKIKSLFLRKESFEHLSILVNNLVNRKH